MPRSKEPGAAIKRLVEELAGRNVTVSYRAVEGWAAIGLAPAPARRSLGRGRGTFSEYPPGAADQYAAVASVMRRGRPWQVSVLKLLARGHMPADETLVRRAFHDLLAVPEQLPGQDALGYAEQVAAGAANTLAGRPFLRAFERNLRRSAQILEPGTQIGAVAVGVVATLTLARIGEPQWSQEALIEMIAAHGIPVGEMTDDRRADLARFAEAFFIQVTASAALAQIAAESPLRRIQTAIPQARVVVAEALAGFGRDFPQPGEDIAEVLTAAAALILIRIEDLGGDEAMAGLAAQALAPDHTAA
ncbi:MAG: hypothetical protein ACRDOK_26205 [Streptosporangiaceae bacterium]